jgi:hypothetical protein
VSDPLTTYSYSYSYLPAAGPGPVEDDYDYDYTYPQGAAAYPVPELNLPEQIVPERDGHEHEPVDDVNGPCQHPNGSAWCPSHSIHSSYANMNDAAHSDYGTTGGTGGTGGLLGSEDDDSKMLSPEKKERRSVSLPPTLERYVHDRQSHEMLASGHVTHNERQSKKLHKRKARLSIENNDIDVEEGRADDEGRAGFIRNHGRHGHHGSGRR